MGGIPDDGAGADHRRQRGAHLGHRATEPHAIRPCRVGDAHAADPGAGRLGGAQRFEREPLDRALVHVVQDLVDRRDHALRVRGQPLLDRDTSSSGPSRRASCRRTCRARRAAARGSAARRSRRARRGCPVGHADLAAARRPPAAGRGRCRRRHRARTPRGRRGARRSRSRSTRSASTPERSIELVERVLAVDVARRRCLEPGPIGVEERPGSRPARSARPWRSRIRPSRSRCSGP